MSIKNTAILTILSSSILVGCATKTTKISLENPPNKETLQQSSINEDEDEHQLSIKDIKNTNDNVDTKEHNGEAKALIEEPVIADTLGLWNNNNVNFNFELPNEFFQEDKLDIEYYNKYSKYFPKNLNEYLILLQNKSEQDLIISTWLSDIDSYEYYLFSTPIFTELEVKFKKSLNKNTLKKINDKSEKKKQLLIANYNNTTHEQKLITRPLFQFPLDFETSVLKEGFFQSISPMYLHQGGNPKSFSSYMINNYKILDKNNKEIPLSDLNKMNIESLSFSVKQCLKFSSLDENQFNEHLTFAKNLLNNYNYQKMDYILQTKVSPERYKEISKNKDLMDKSLTKQFVIYYQKTLSNKEHLKYDNKSCSEIFDLYSIIYKKINFSPK